MFGSYLRACRVRDCRGSEAVVLVVIERAEITAKTMECERNPGKPDRRRRELPNEKLKFHH